MISDPDLVKEIKKELERLGYYKVTLPKSISSYDYINIIRQWAHRTFGRQGYSVDQTDIYDVYEINHKGAWFNFFDKHFYFKEKKNVIAFNDALIEFEKLGKQ